MAALRGEPTGQARSFRGDVGSVAKQPLKAGEVLDGEGGSTVWGKLMPVSESLARGALPIGLAHDVKLVRDVTQGDVVLWRDVEPIQSAAAIARRDMQAAFASRATAAE